MYTVIWINAHGNDRWDRYESSEEVNELLDREDARNGDTWVFLPDADDCAITGIDFDR